MASKFLNAKKIISLPPNTEVQASGGFTYIAYSPPGTALSTASWLAFRITDATGSTMYADGNDKYDNVATDLTTLTYSFS